MKFHIFSAALLFFSPIASAIFSAKSDSFTFPAADQLQSPLWIAPTFRWGPQEFNISGPIFPIVKNAACNPLPYSNLSKYVVMVMGFQGCSYEDTMRNLEVMKPKCVVFMGKLTGAGGVEAYITDGTSTKDFTVPTVGVAITPFVAVLQAWLVEFNDNKTMTATIVADSNPFRELFESAAITLHQMILGSLSLFLMVLSGYKLFLFIQAQKGIKLNISQVCLMCEVFTNLLRFMWSAIDPFHGARDTLTWGFIRWLFTSHVAINFISLILIGFYWSDLVNTTSGAKSAFLQKPQTKAAAVFVTLVIFTLEIFSAIQDAAYIGGHLWTLLSACMYMVGWLFVGTWFFRCGHKLVAALKVGGKGADASVKGVSRRIYTIAALQHVNWLNMLGLSFLGSANDTLYYIFFTSFLLFMGLGSYLQICVFNPPQWKAKMQVLKERAGVSSNYSASTVAANDP